VKPVKVPIQPVCWDVDEEAGEERGEETRYRVSSPESEDEQADRLSLIQDEKEKLHKEVWMSMLSFPIRRKEHGNRNDQTGKLVASYWGRGYSQLFIRAVGRRWLKWHHQDGNFASTLEEAYATLDRSLERIVGNATFTRKSEDDYVQEMAKQELPGGPEEGRMRKQGIGFHDELAGALGMALLRVIVNKLLTTDGQTLKLTNGQMMKLIGASKAQLWRIKGCFITTEKKRASACELLVELRKGRRDESTQGRGVPTSYALGADVDRLLFPFADEDDGEREYYSEDEADGEREEIDQWLRSNPTNSSADATPTVRCVSFASAPTALTERRGDTATEPDLLTTVLTTGTAREAKEGPRRNPGRRCGSLYQGRVRCCDGSEPLIWSRYERD
jgi:hypothetical protein